MTQVARNLNLRPGGIAPGLPWFATLPPAAPQPRYTRIQLRCDTAEAWAEANPVLALGEMGLESDTRRLKFGTGALRWTALGYVQFGS